MLLLNLLLGNISYVAAIPGAACENLFKSQHVIKLNKYKVNTTTTKSGRLQRNTLYQPSKKARIVT